MGLTRRQFLKVAGTGVAAAAGTTLINNNSGTKAYASEPWYSEMKYTTCGFCDSRCGMKAYIEDGVLMKFEGNPDDQSGGGRLCGKGQGAVQFLYDSDRLKYPMKRTNPQKGIGIDPKWQRISWDEAFDIIGSKINEAKKTSGVQSIMYVGKLRCNDLMKAIGTPNIISHNTTCNITPIIGNISSFGYYYLFPDLEKCNYLLAFGWDMPGKGKNVFERRYTDFLERRGTKAVIFDPRLSNTAAKADEWIPVRPGADIAVALAMINIIIKEDIYDKDFVEKYTVGFDEVAAAVKEYTPEWAEKLSDVSASTITRIAREFAAAKPAVIPIHKRGVHVMRREGFELVHAGHILMAITGNVDVEGGIRFPRQFSLSRVSSKKKTKTPKGKRVDGADNKKFSSIVKSFGIEQILPEALASNKPYAIECAIVCQQSVFSFSDSRRTAEALAKMPFMVDISVQADEMAMLADIVLPESTWLEKDDIKTPTVAYYPQVSVQQAVVKPLYDTKPLEEIKKGIASRLELEDYLEPFGEKVLDAKLSKIGISFDELRKMGVYSQKEEFQQRDLANLSTPSKKIELTWSRMKKNGYPTVPTYRDEYVMKPTEEYPFYFTTTRSALRRHSNTANISWIAETEPENKLIMNASRAKKLGIKDGDWVRIKSRVGMITMKVDLTEGIRPDTVCIPHGFGHWSKFMTNAYSKGTNDGEIMPVRNLQEMLEADDPSANAADCDIMVKVEKA